MNGPAKSGIFIYAQDVTRLALFYQQVIGCEVQHTDDDMVVMGCPGLQLLVHRIPAEIGKTIQIESPPLKRENTALKFFVTLNSIDAARRQARNLGGDIFAENWQGPGFVVCNAMDCEGNVFQVREPV